MRLYSTIKSAIFDPNKPSGMSNPIPSMFRVFKTRNPRGFNYKPMYYDADKEERDAREADIRRELKLEADAKHTAHDGEERRIKFERGRFDQRQRSKAPSYNNGRQQANVRLLVILTLLIGAAVAVWSWSDGLLGG